MASSPAAEASIPTARLRKGPSVCHQCATPAALISQVNTVFDYQQSNGEGEPGDRRLSTPVLR